MIFVAFLSTTLIQIFSLCFFADLLMESVSNNFYFTIYSCYHHQYLIVSLFQLHESWRPCFASFPEIENENIKYLIRGRSWRSGTRCDCKTNWLWVRSSLEDMKYLPKFIFPFRRSGVQVKRGVEFCHSTRNASRIWQEVRNGSVLTLGSLCLPCCVWDTA